MSIGRFLASSDTRPLPPAWLPSRDMALPAAVGHNALNSLPGQHNSLHFPGSRQLNKSRWLLFMRVSARRASLGTVLALVRACPSVRCFQTGQQRLQSDPRREDIGGAGACSAWP